MNVDTILLLVGFTGLLVGSITDIRKREVPDWLNYSLIFAGLGIRLLHAISSGEWMFFVYGLIGFGTFLAVAYAMFYTGQWGGGDSKLLMGMGALFATYPTSLISYFHPQLFGIPFLVTFWVNLLMVGAVYGLLWTFGLGIVHFKDFKKSFAQWMKKPLVITIRRYVFIGMVLGVLLAIIIPSFTIRITILVMSFLCFTFFYMYISVRAIEKACMFRVLSPNELVEGDWPINDIIVDGKDIFPKAKRLGFEATDLEKLRKLYEQKKIGKIKVKHGIPFVPSFLFSLLVSLTYGNVLAFIIF